jgi:2'-5' RNA ligase
VTALVLIPAYTPPLTETAHMTMVWAGDVADSGVLAALGIVGANWARHNRAFGAKVMGLALFGEKHNEPVLLVELTAQIAMLRAAVQQYSQSEYTEFRPHVAIPGLTSKVRNTKTRPKHLYFNQMALWAGEHHKESETLWWLGG